MKDLGIKMVKNKNEPIERYTGIMSRAFADDPVVNYLYPVRELTPELESWFFGSGVRYYMEHGTALTTEEVNALALWLSPEQLNISILGMYRAGIFYNPFKIGLRSMQRIYTSFSTTTRAHRKYTSGDHWYLYSLSVDPSDQGKGIGSSLMHPILQQADRDGLPCYLVASTDRSVPLYQRHGFRVIEELKLPNGPPLWAMLREPKV